ncbi:alpha/beta hydrolase [Dactylosporangium aurantiacum]|uniref:Alpha/beta hydrolase n=1 Tax=Dactylosporangium aurantiacum TaxID=35754 RepID=A0A9Q9MEF8_9ACTN|nr:alpha/beta hydrolase [Dactylosporangium aurantiacum]MDG6107086.1 alpha/beta hydrolase [Dactylosporangium aurantiacum]UWZ51385.1 alpha/beta hydrolase [Dactylosporangium aurantiacum]
MTVFVLVHGAFRGGWAWSRVRRALAAAGHEVHTPSLTGMGDRRHLTAEPPSLDTWALDIANLLAEEDLRDVVLAGHSLGGVAIAAAARRCADRLARLVFLDAPEPLPGERAAGLLGPVPDLPRDLWLPAKPLDPAADPSLDPDTVAWMNARLCPTPLAPSLDPMPAQTVASAAVPRTHLFCTGTPPGYPASVTLRRLRAGGAPYRLIDSGHDAPLSRPVELAALLAGPGAA